MRYADNSQLTAGTIIPQGAAILGAGVFTASSQARAADLPYVKAARPAGPTDLADASTQPLLSALYDRIGMLTDIATIAQGRLHAACDRALGTEGEACSTAGSEAKPASPSAAVVLHEALDKLERHIRQTLRAADRLDRIA